jgi:uncharacterized protein YxjI
MTSLLGADTLVVSQKAKLIELTNQYEIRDSDGATLGYVEQEGQSRVRKALRFVTDVDQFLTHRLSVYDSAHTRVLELTRPAKLFKSRLTVNDGHGRRVGEIVQLNVFGKIRFDLVGALGERLGQIRAENWRGMGLLDRRPGRDRDRHDRQEVRRGHEGGVHDRRQLRRLPGHKPRG